MICLYLIDIKLVQSNLGLLISFDLFTESFPLRMNDIEKMKHLREKL